MKMIPGWWFLLLISFNALAYDPNEILVEDPSIQVLHELPSGSVFLKDYRAPNSLIDEYSRAAALAAGDLKDNPKAPDCTRAEVHALKRWASNAVYKKVNDILRRAQKGSLDGVLISRAWENLVLMIASGVNCAPQYRGEVTRLENTPSVILHQYVPGRYILARGFSSTTKGKKYAPSMTELYKNAIQIYYPKAQGADLDIMGVSAWWAEKEVLLRPGTVFKVVSRQPVIGDPFVRLLFQFQPF